jgi:predicted nucleic acid-binding protein
MNAKYFIDTNVFVYSFDSRQPNKKERALGLIQEALRTNSGMISTQVIQEFLNVATQKFAVPLKIDDARAYLRLVMNPLCQIYPSLALYESCLELQAETRYSFYDSLILAAALQGGCDVLYSEDMQDGQKVRNLKIVNPYQEN